MKKQLVKAKLIIEVESDKTTKRLKTVSVFDNRENEYWNNERIVERGIIDFINVEDLKETANWNLNGDSSKYRLKWGQSSKTKSTGYAYIFA